MLDWLDLEQNLSERLILQEIAEIIFTRIVTIPKASQNNNFELLTIHA